MVTREEAHRLRIWGCLHCRGLLATDAQGLRCVGCRKLYPVIAGVPVLVSEPIAYLRSELDSLARAYRDASQRREMLDSGHDAGLTPVSLARHRDVINAEIAQIEVFLALLEPAAGVLQQIGETAEETLGVRRSGWAFDGLIPYLLRDWTNTSELEAASSMIGASVKQMFPDPSGKTIAVAGCGAGGLLPRLSPDFERVLGFDLTLAILNAARHLLDGKSLDLALPRSISKGGHICLRNRGAPSAASHVEVLAMDAFDMAFANGSIDCIITSFLVDLIPDPLRLAVEIHRVLCDDGVWINYGPSGPLKALWRFDQTECAAFFQAAGFTVVQSDACRATYLDLSRDCPSWSFQNHMCYLTSARKSGQPIAAAQTTALTEAELPDVVPQFFPRANLIRRRSLGAEQRQTLVLRQERIPGRAESVEIDSGTAQIIELVDGKRTVREIADLLEQSVPPQDTLRGFGRYFAQGLLTRHNGRFDTVPLSAPTRRTKSEE
jgi:SAM-dependent methyltransferase